MWTVEHDGVHGQGDTLEEALADIERNAETRVAALERSYATVKFERAKRVGPAK